MDDFREMEEQLQQQLRHVSLPPGFTDRVMARIPATKRTWQRSIVSIPQPAWLAVAATLVLSVTGGEVRHVQHQRHAEAVAEEQLNRALQLTGHAMSEVETGVERSAAGRYAVLWNGN